MKKQIILIMIILLACIGCIALSACVDEAPPVVKKYSLTFDVNGGNEHNTTITIDENSDFYVPENPTRDTYTFAGWHTANGTDDENWGDEFTSYIDIKDDITVYAKWEIFSRRHGVIFYTDCDINIPSLSIEENGLLVDIPTLTKTGYTFSGWYTNPELTTAFDISKDAITENISLYASWTTLQIALTFNVDGGTDVPLQTINYDTFGIEPTPPTNQNLFFNGWYMDPAFTQPFLFSYYTLTEDTTLYAKWNIFEVSYNLEFELHQEIFNHVDYYSIKGIGTETKTQFALPDVHNGKLVKYVDSSLFSYDSIIESLYVPYAFTLLMKEQTSSAPSTGSRQIFYVFTERPKDEIHDNLYAVIYHNVESNDLAEKDGALYIKNDKSATLAYIGNEQSSTFAEEIEFRDVTLPVEKVGDYSFYGMKNLSEVIFPKHIKSIGTYAFYTSSISSILLNDGLTEISSWALSHTELIELTIPSTVTHLGEGFATQTISLRTIIFSENSQLIDIGRRAFAYTGITSVEIPKSLETINPEAFYVCKKLQTLTFEEGSALKLIGNQAFYYNESLGSFILPESLTTIGYDAFYDTDITTLTIPARVSFIGKSAFTSCLKLAEIITDENNLHYKSVDGILYNYDQSTLLQYPVSKSGSTFKVPDTVTKIGYETFHSTMLTEVQLPDSLITIDDRAFCFMQSLRTIIIPDGVTRIGDGAFSFSGGLNTINIPASVQEIGEGAFLQITLDNITVDANNKYFTTVDGILYSKDMTRLIHYPTMSKPETTFIIPNTVTRLDEGAFCSLRYRGLTTIVIPDSVIEMGNYPFIDCYNKDLKIFFEAEREEIRHSPGLALLNYYASGEWEMVNGVPQVI